MDKFIKLVISLLQSFLKPKPIVPTSAPAVAPYEAAERLLEVDGLELIKAFEGLRLKAYLCSARVWTIGYGHTKGVKQGAVCTQAEADAFLLEDVKWVLTAVERTVKVPLTPGQRAAINSFVFNCGAGAFRTSTMLRKLNTGDYKGAAAEFPRWNKAGGKVINGLVSRRKAERKVFLS
jgi:lysozyme